MTGQKNTDPEIYSKTKIVIFTQKSINTKDSTISEWIHAAARDLLTDQTLWNHPWPLASPPASAWTGTSRGLGGGGGEGKGAAKWCILVVRHSQLQTASVSELSKFDTSTCHHPLKWLWLLSSPSQQYVILKTLSTSPNSILTTL